MIPPSNLTLVFPVIIIIIIITSNFNPVNCANNTRSSNKYRRGLTQANQTQVTPSHLHQRNEQSAPEGNFKKITQSQQSTTNSISIEQENVERIVDSWNSLDFFATKFTNRLVHQILEPVFDDLFINSDISLGCQSAIRTVLRDAGRMKKYAVQILDSSGRFPPSGLLEGTLTDLGHFDECIDVNEVRESNDNPVTTRIQGQYCSLIITPPLPPRPRFHTLCNPISSLETLSSESSVFRWLGQNAHSFYYSPIRIGACVPSQCSSNDVNTLISKMAASFNLTGSLLNMKCESKTNQHQVYPTQLFCMLILLVIALVIITATLVDISGIGINDKVASFMPIHLKQQEIKLMNWPFKSTANAFQLETESVSPASWCKSKVNDVTKDELMATSGHDSSVTDCSQWVKLLLCFSFKKNASAILSIEASKDEQSPSSTSSSSSAEAKSKQDTLPVIHGLRVLTMAWIIMGHTYGLVNPHIHSQVFSARFMYTNFLYQGLLNATLSVDTFFFISGLLTVYVFWKKFKPSQAGSKYQSRNSNKFNLLSALTLTLIRYLRLTPPYALVIALTFIFPLTSTGPLWRETTEPIVNSCYASWWTNLFYINNFYMTDKLCLMHSWYLSNDMQMHMFALIVIYLLLKSKALAFILIAITMIACTTYCAIETFVNKYPPTIVSTSPVVDDRWKYIIDYYYKPWPHLPSYCIGLITGYALATGSHLRLTTGQRRTSWLFVLLLSFVVLYGVYPWNLGWNISPEITAMYSSTFRTVWTACVAWMTVSLLTVNGQGLMAKCLSWKGLLPLSRLTYMAFLIHPFVIWYYWGSMRERFTASHFNYLHLFLGHYLLTYLLSFVFGACIESPCMALIKLLMQSNGSSVDTSMPSKITQGRRKENKFTHHSSSSNSKKQHQQAETASATAAVNTQQIVSDIASNVHENYIFTQSVSPPVSTTFIPQPISPTQTSQEEMRRKILLFAPSNGPTTKAGVTGSKKSGPIGFYTYHLTSTFDSSDANSTENMHYI